jgi:hypothetical protein
MSGGCARQRTHLDPAPDGTLAALALERLGENDCVARWRWMFGTRFGLHHGRRPAAWHVPSMLSIGTARAWEQAAASALAHRAGWIDDEDWWCCGRGVSAPRRGTM